MVAVVAIMMLGTTAAQAQAQGQGGGRGQGQQWAQMKPEDMAARMHGMIREKLVLDTNQSESVKALCLERAYAMRDVVNKARESQDWASIRPAMEESEKAFDASMKAVLKPEQWAKYEKYKEEEKARRRQMRMERQRESGGMD